MGRHCTWAERDRFLVWLTDNQPRGLGLADNTALARACCMSAFYAAGFDLTDDAALQAHCENTDKPQVRAYRRAAVAAYRRWQATLAAPRPAGPVGGIAGPPGAPGPSAPPPRPPGPPAAAPAPVLPPEPAAVLDAEQEAALAAFYGGGGAPAMLLARLTWADVLVVEDQLHLRVPDDLRAGFGAAALLPIGAGWYLPALSYEAHAATMLLHTVAGRPLLGSPAAAATPLVVCGADDRRPAPPVELRRVRQVVNARRAAALPPAVITMPRPDNG